VKTDGLFDYRVVKAPFKKYGQQISLYCISDVHRNSPACAADRWHQFLEGAKEDRNDKYFLFLGDMVDALSTSERKTYVTGGFHDSTMLRWEQEYEADIKLLAHELSFCKGRTLACFGGNHYFKFQNGETSDMRLASELGCTYVGCSGYIILILEEKNGHAHVVKIFAHHGRSGGRTAGGSMNPLEQAAAKFRADIILMGHDHQRGARQCPVLDCETGKGGRWRIKEKNVLVARTGSFLKSYEPGKASYSVDALMNPASIGALKVILRPMRRSTEKPVNDERWVDIEAVI